jgi:hypothetical protein
MLNDRGCEAAVTPGLAGEAETKAKLIGNFVIVGPSGVTDMDDEAIDIASVEAAVMEHRRYRLARQRDCRSILKPADTGRSHSGNGSGSAHGYGSSATLASSDDLFSFLHGVDFV